MKYLCIHNVSIHINFYQNRFINECGWKTFLKFSYRRKDIHNDGVFCANLSILLLIIWFKIRETYTIEQESFIFWFDGSETLLFFKCKMKTVFYMSKKDFMFISLSHSLSRSLISLSPSLFLSLFVYLPLFSSLSLPLSLSLSLPLFLSHSLFLSLSNCKLSKFQRNLKRVIFVGQIMGLEFSSSQL